MTNFIIKHFVENERNKDKDKRQIYAFVCSIIGIALNLFLSFLKMGVGFVFSSVSVLGDGVNNLSDATSSIVTLVGFKMSAKPADKKHPYGHARMEYVSGLIVSFIIMFIGVQLFFESFKKILKPEELEFSAVVIVSLIISIIVKFWLYIFNKKIGNKINSHTIIATSKDSRNDIFITTGVLSSILINHYFAINLDGFIGVALSAIIVYSGFMLITDTLSPLLGEAPNKELVADIYSKLLKYENVIGIHDLMVHTYGYNKNFASVHVEMDEKLGFLVCHDTADKIERDFKDFGINLVVHLDPTVTDCEESDKYKNEIMEIVQSVDARLSMHDFRAVLGPMHKNFIFDIVLPCEVAMTEEETKTAIIDAINKKFENCHTVVQIDKHYLGF